MAIVGSPNHFVGTAGETYTAGAGSDRLVVFLVITANGPSNPGTGVYADRAVSLGGVQAAEVAFSQGNATTAMLQIIKEADIPAGDNAVSFGSEVLQCVAYTLSGRDQATPVFPGSVVSRGQIGATTWGSLINTADGSDVFVAANGQTDSRSVSSASGLPFQDFGIDGGRRLVALVDSGIAAPEVVWSLTWTDIQGGTYTAASFQPSLTITDINTTNEVTPGATATVTGTNLTNATGLNIGSQAQADFTVVSDTEVTFTGTRGGNPYNQDLTATLLSPDGNATITVQQVPATGFAVTAASPNTTDDASLWSGLVDTATGDPVTVVDGDQALIKSGPTGVAVDPDGTITADETGDLVVQFWRQSEGVWGSDQTVSFVVPGEEDSYPFSKGIKYAAEKNWTWGGRHPKTGMRVRIFK